MGQVTARDAGKALELLAQLSAAATGTQAFARASVRAMAGLVGADLTTLSVCTFAGGRRRVTAFPERALSVDDVACFDRHFFAHPLVCFHRQHPDGGTHRLSDSLALAAFRRTSLYADYYRRIGIEHVVAVPLHVDTDVLVSMVLNRSGRDFNTRELALLDAVRAPLVTLYHHARMADHLAAVEASLRAQVGAGAWHEIEVDGAGRIRRASRHALRLLGVQSGAGPGATLPQDVIAWLRRLQVRPVVGTVLRRDSVDGSLALRAIPLVAHGIWRLLIAQAAPSPSAAASPGGVALTPRERDVLGWVRQGKSDLQIAAILGISVRTVQKHLERVYAKLGVENRVAAVMRVSEAAVTGGPRSH